MSKKIERIPADDIRELPLAELEAVLGGAGAAPMGMGSSLAQQVQGTHPLGNTVGYQDHFGLHFGGGGFDPGHDASGHAAQLAGVSGSHGTDASATTATAASHGPGPMGMGGSLGGDTSAAGDALHGGDGVHGGGVAHASASHDQADVNATSAFQLLDQASPQDDAAGAAAHDAPAPVGLGGDF
jgi:hypothetical protein|nr:hypothetical protein [Kofleriaceae bacterium]